jgi:hypothetical protein
VLTSNSVKWKWVYPCDWVSCHHRTSAYTWQHKETLTPMHRGLNPRPKHWETNSIPLWFSWTLFRRSQFQIGMLYPATCFVVVSRSVGPIQKLSFFAIRYTDSHFYDSAMSVIQVIHLTLSARHQCFMFRSGWYAPPDR